MSTKVATNALKYAPYTSSVDAGFWHAFSKRKVEEYKLSCDPVNIFGSYNNTDESGCSSRLSVIYSAFTRQEPSSSSVFSCPGLLLHTNTIEEFQSSDKKALLYNVAEQHFWKCIMSGEALHEPRLLSFFLMYVFADLKKYHYKYWFAFPAYISHSEVLEGPVETLESAWTQQEIDNLISSYQCRSQDVDGAFFVLERFPDDTCMCHPLKDYKKMQDEGAQVLLCAADPSSIASVPGWPVRNLLTLAFMQWPSHHSHRVLCVRERTCGGIRSVAQSLLFRVTLQPRPSDSASPGEALPSVCRDSPPPCVGWEKTSSGFLGPISLDLSKTMDPEKVNDSACELSLQLMRWRAVPSLDVTRLQETRCLLLGAGTLGCNVARGLLGWGIRHMTFVDSGQVSHSNPVRQSLYDFTDCLGGGREKAMAAAEALKRIRPSVVSHGVSLTIPMPGHPPGPSQIAAITEAIQQLGELIAQHDAVFLLTDSRESRWLPTLMSASLGKIVITAALGFDSFTVIRHGSKSHRAARQTLSEDEAGSSSSQGAGYNQIFDCFSKEVAGSCLGCYFCNDVAVPGDSQHDRTLDQQCTVSRPGVSMMAAAETVEMLAALLQHPDRQNAPSGVTSSEGALGVVPHSVRFFLGTRKYFTPTTPAFRECSACGEQVLRAYERDGTDFVLAVLDSSAFLESVSGITGLLCVTEEEMRDELSMLSVTDEESDCS